MNDEKKTPDERPADEHATIEQPVAEPAPAPAASPAPATTDRSTARVFSSPRTRNILLTSAAGVALASGVIGFGIGHATADGGDGGPGDRMSRFAPGDGRPNFGNRNDDGGGRGDRPGPGDDSGNESGAQPNGADDPT